MSEPIRIAIIYTGMPTLLVDAVENELRKALGDIPATFVSLSDPDIIRDAVRNGAPSPQACRRLMGMYMSAVSNGADIVYNACSSVGDVADAAKPIMEKMGIPFVRIDEEMAAAAVRECDTIGVIATLSSTLEPTKGLLRRMAAQQGREVTLLDALADGAFGLGAGQLDALLLERAMPLRERADGFVLAQGSMAGAQAAIARETGKKNYASPAYGAKAVACAARKIWEKRHG